MSRQWVLKWASILLGLVVSFAIIYVAEVYYGMLNRYSPTNPYPYHPGAPRLDLTNQMILGSAATSHGIFPPFPTNFHGARVPPRADDSSVLKIEKSLFRPHPKYPIFSLYNTGRASRTQGDHLVYDVKYTADSSWGRRLVPGQDGKTAKDFLILLGCSYTFGEGLEDNETLPYYLGQRAPTTRVYNYGFPGASTGEAWIRLKTIAEEPQITEKSGTVIYLFIDNHVPRTLGKMSVIGVWGKDKLHFFRDASGEIQTDGTFSKTRPIQTSVYHLLSQSNILNYYHADIPWWTSDSDWRLLGSIVKDMKLEAEKLGAKRFLVVFYPGTETSTQFIPYLEKEGISYIDYSHWRMDSLTFGPARIPYDGHPSAESNKVLAESLAEQLQLH